ncbi:CoA transferase (plasmid) [Sphingobium sp. SJ10-10]|uniref:L-carnitine dehydratase/bile acid-inducible protein F n=1 Tax=Sphingomonas sp. NS2 TaxID=908605 RepID=A0A0D4ZZ06_9SPHN|nr:MULTISPECIES: CoA transferase [unclassified Sphingobium]AJW29384.1 L-carnitine dehydratase/bile acid-inducible protein F [Sphingomonas sp. NS2]AMK26585.1 formyl-CoA transferase [Sphingobium sp. TKS]MEC6699605.1 CoA transferase [Sphingobium sp. SJ10-10]NML91705.1 CoA transferase [Sphingobium sp. TB-6]
MSDEQGGEGGVLSGIRVLEIGHFVAAPFCTRLLGDLGAEVIKIEPPQGDPVRQWGAQVNGRSLWWSVHGRNKRSVALDLKTPAGRQVLLDLVEHCDVVVENFRPGQLAKMGLAPEVLRERQPGLIVAHVSGYGQSGPGRNQAAFGVIGEAIGGIRHLTNHPPGTYGLPPVRVGVSIGDSLAGLYAAFGIVSALWRRESFGADPRFQMVDVALTESVLSLMEGMLPEFGALGKVKQPTGGAIATAAPSNAYPTADGQWILIAANSEPLFAKLLGIMDRADLIDDPRFQGNAQRVRHACELDALIEEWSRGHAAERLSKMLADADIPASKVYTAEDIARDPQYRARGMVRELEDPLLGMVLHPGIVPHFPDGPGQVRNTGPDIGADSETLLKDLLGYDETHILELKSAGVLK